MAKIPNIEKAFVTKLKALYDIEKELEKALPKMEKAVLNPMLKEGFRTHLEETRGHIARLEEVFGMLEMKPSKLKSEGIRGIVEDGSWVMEQDAPENVKDAMIASAARYAEHYEMAGYMSAIEEARALGRRDIAEILLQNLEEEKVADKKLSMVLKESLRSAE